MYARLSCLYFSRHPLNSFRKRSKSFLLVFTYPPPISKNQQSVYPKHYKLYQQCHTTPKMSMEIPEGIPFLVDFSKPLVYYGKRNGNYPGRFIENSIERFRRIMVQNPSNAMRLLDLFSGIGGFSLAAQWCWGDELEIEAFVEIDPFCQKVLKKNFPGVPIYWKIQKKFCKPLPPDKPKTYKETQNTPKIENRPPTLIREAIVYTNPRKNLEMTLTWER